MAEEQYFIVRDGKDEGPYAVSELRDSLEQGAIGRQVEVRSKPDVPPIPLWSALAKDAQARQPAHGVDRTPYFVVTPKGDDGPFVLEALRGSYEQGFLDREVQVRTEGGKPVALRLVLSSAGERRAGAVDAVLTRENAKADGNFNTGLLLGFFFGALAMIASVAVKPKTRTGILVGAIPGIAIGILVAFILPKMMNHIVLQTEWAIAFGALGAIPASAIAFIVGILPTLR